MEISFRMIFLFICGPAMQIGLYIPPPIAWPPPTAVVPLSHAPPGPHQYVSRTSSF